MTAKTKIAYLLSTRVGARSWTTAALARRVRRSVSFVCRCIRELSADRQTEYGFVNCLRCRRRFLSPNKCGRRICTDCNAQNQLIDSPRFRFHCTGGGKHGT